MDHRYSKDMYIAAAVWGISSILFFNYVSREWMQVWLKITTGLLQLAALGYIAFQAYRMHHPRTLLIGIAFCIDVVVTALALIHYCTAQ